MECLELNTLDLRYRVPPAKGEAAGREILAGVTTTFAAADVNAIMGPSGSGKSTLLEVVSMTRTVGTMAGDVLIDGMPMRGGGADAAALEAWYGRNSTFVAQQDVFWPAMTVQELALYTAFLQLPVHMLPAAKARVARSRLAMLGLDGRLDTRIGDGGVSVEGGLSGGQRRRLSVFQQIIVPPKFLFLDEPTSGLDATGALDIARCFRAIADTGITVILTIHQPRDEVWQLLDTVTALVRGRVGFAGTTAQVELQKFSPPTCGPTTTTADRLIDFFDDVQKRNAFAAYVDGEWLPSALATAQRRELDAKRAAAIRGRTWVDAERSRELMQVDRDASFAPTRHKYARSRLVHNDVALQNDLWVIAVVAATRLRSHAPLIAMAVFRTVFVAVGIGLIYLDAVDKSAWRATMALHVSFTAIPFLSDGSFNYLNAALEGVVPRRDYGNGQLTFVAHVLSLMLVNGLTITLCAVPYALVCGSLVGVSGTLLARYLALVFTYFYLISTIQECISFCVGLGRDHNVPMLGASILLTAFNGVLVSPGHVEDWMKPFYLVNPSFWFNIAVFRSVVANLESPDDPHDDVYDYVATNGASIATAWGVYGDDLFGVSLTFTKAYGVILAYAFFLRALGAARFMRGGRFRPRRTFVPAGGGDAVAGRSEDDAKRAEARRQTSIAAMTKRGLAKRLLSGLGRTAPSERSPSARAIGAAEPPPECVNDLYASFRSSPCVAYYEWSLAEASKLGLAHVAVAYLDAVFRASRALVRVPAGADAALTACLLLAYAALLLRFVAVHGLREGAHAAGFEDEPALRPALRGLAAAAAAASAGYAAAAVGTVVLYGAADPAVAHGVSFLALALRVVEMAVRNRIRDVVRHLLALGTKRSHLEIHRRAFALFDRDRNGSIDRRELGDALRSFNRALSDADLADIIESADSDGTGTIEFPEFLDIVRPQNATEDAFLDAGS